MKLIFEGLTETETTIAAGAVLGTLTRHHFEFLDYTMKVKPEDAKD